MLNPIVNLNDQNTLLIQNHFGFLESKLVWILTKPICIMDQIMPHIQNQFPNLIKINYEN